MKSSFLGLFLLLSTTTIVAQDLERDRDQLHTEEKLRLRDRLVIKNGEVLRIQNQQQIKLENQLTLENGTIVYPDGSIQKINRNRIQLRDGECLSMSGKKYKNEERFMNRVRSKERQMDRREEHRVQRMQNGKEPMQRRSEKMQNRGGKGRS